LGLAIVKHIMQKHGGNVRVESQLGKGTEFICEFPNHILTQS
jgi:signal transduction histidine kinase